MKTKIIFLVLISAGVLVINSCKEKKVFGCTDKTAIDYNPQAQEDDGTCTYEFQGPKNPGFEDNTAWKVITSSSGYPSFVEGTGFMPTQGIMYLNLSGSVTNNYHSFNVGAYQDVVDFSLSKTLTFDYSIDSYGKGVYEFNIMFTANGTDTLWNLLDSNAVAIQKKSELITLPSLPDKGKLTIECKLISGSSSSNEYPRVVVKVDNIRVQ